ncbi:hypothetical protein CLV56_4116 [Mumia flava]|uniref:Uncharacterized protein n=2 Tax=Mumia flava TaxID=1348852 RepID=A0A2M9AQ74_9ACTN|nr:hypothetical protein CLV56_4116 [Mumia flava]
MPPPAQPPAEPPAQPRGSATGPPRRRPAAGWYAVGAVIATLGVIGALALGVGTLVIAVSARPEPVGPAGTFTMPRGDLAVWVRADGLERMTDRIDGMPSGMPGDGSDPSDGGPTGAELGVTCMVAPSGDATLATEVPALRYDRAEFDDWHLVAVLPQADARHFAGDKMQIACSSRTPLLAEAEWATGSKPALLWLIVLIGGAFLVGVGGLAVGAVAALVVWLLRRRSAAA